MPRLSVITPFHNTPKDLFQACADSVLSQGMADFEWIIIDDGSEEKSAKFLKDFCEKDSRICLIVQEANGVSAARNQGLEEKTGEFFTFVDSDDIISPNFFEEALEVATRTQADIVYGVLTDTDNPLASTTLAGIPERVFQGPDKERLLRCIISGKDTTDMENIGVFRLLPVAPRVYRSDVFPDEHFEVHMSYGEDSLFNAQTVQRASTVTLSPRIWYTYVIHNSSSVYRHLSHEEALNMLSSFNRYHDVGRKQGWQESDIGMRFLHNFLLTINLYAGYSSTYQTWLLVRDVLRMPVVQSIKYIRFSDYYVQGRVFYKLTLLATATSSRCKLTFPIAVLAKARHVVKEIGKVAQ